MFLVLVNRNPLWTDWERSSMCSWMSKPRASDAELQDSCSTGSVESQGPSAFYVAAHTQISFFSGFHHSSKFTASGNVCLCLFTRLGVGSARGGEGKSGSKERSYWIYDQGFLSQNSSRFLLFSHWPTLL